MQGYTASFISYRNINCQHPLFKYQDFEYKMNRYAYLIYYMILVTGMPALYREDIRI